MSLTLLPGATGCIFDALCAFFESDGWTVERLDDSRSLRMGFRGKNGSWLCVARALEDNQLLIVYSVLGGAVPEARRTAAAEFLTRANYGMFLGSFELDFGDGEVRFRTSLGVEDGVLTEAMIRRLVYTNVIMMDRYFPGLMSVAHGGVDPARAIREIEDDGA